MKADDFGILLMIAEKGGLYNEFSCSTTRLSREFGLSQQALSRRLIQLEHAGFLQRSVSPRGLVMRLTTKSSTYLRAQHQILARLFQTVSHVEGTIIDGIGEGSYYVKQRKYQQQYLAFLGFRPFSGTLNLRVVPAAWKQFVHGMAAFRVKGFVTKDRTFGGFVLYKIAIARKGSPTFLDAAIVLPDRTRYGDDVLEIIAPVHLRDTFQLSSGDTMIMQPRS
ncbi:DUF120 domain-containing protein [Candidatus Woesearchaeota archaeon]|nr:DUF120 domain-containing protein [Candidatus Woesearchaeota archaeon]